MNQLSQIQSQLNLLQAELDKLKQLPDGMIGNSSDSPYIEPTDHYIPQPGEVVLIDDEGGDFEPRIFLKYNKVSNEPFECVSKGHEWEYRNGEPYQTTTWKLCRRLSGEIIEFGCDKPKYYTHLLPEGYEFCEEGEHTGWVKIRLIGDEGENKLGYSFYGLDCANKPYYRPIRPIKYHVAVHEATTIEPNPYQVDWSNAPAYADSHTFEFDDYGWWRGSYLTNDGWIDMAEQSGFTLPTGLDWKQSKTVRS